MDAHILTKNNELLERLIGKVSNLEGSLDTIRTTISEKLNPHKKEFLTDQDLEEIFGLTKSVRYALVNSGRLKKYKASGKTSLSLYRYDEVLAAIEAGIVEPRKKKQ